MTDIIDELSIRYPPLNEAQAAILAPYLAANTAFVEALLHNEQFVRSLAEMLGVPSHRIVFRLDSRPVNRRRSVRTMGSSLLQAHWGIDVRVANALIQSNLSIQEMITASRKRLGNVRNLGDKYISVIMERRKPIPYRALKFAEGAVFDKAYHMLERLREPLRISYVVLEDYVLAITIETFDRAIELLDANNIPCYEVAVEGKPLRVFAV